MTGMVPTVAIRFFPSVGADRVSRRSPLHGLWRLITTHYTVSLPGTGATLLPVFNKNTTALRSPDMISRNGADADTRKGSENRKKLPPSAPFFQRHFNHLSI